MYVTLHGLSTLKPSFVGAAACLKDYHDDVSSYYVPLSPPIQSASSLQGVSLRYHTLPKLAQRQNPSQAIRAMRAF